MARRSTFAGKLYNAVHYGINTETGEIDYERVAELAKNINRNWSLQVFRHIPAL